MAKRVNLLYRLDFASGKAYIGVSTESASRRYSGHQKDTTAGSMLPVHCAWRKYGAPQLIVLAILEREMLPRAEYLAVSKYNTLLPNGYNCVPGGGISPTTLPAIAKKVSIALKGRAKSADHRASLSKAKMGKKPSPETIALLSALRTGTKRSLETRKKMSAWQIGRIRSAETRARISAAKKGKPGHKWTAEQRLKLSIIKMGIKRPERTRLKIAANNRMRAQLKRVPQGQLSLTF